MVKSAIKNRDCSELVEKFLRGEGNVFVERECADDEFTPFLHENGSIPMVGEKYSVLYVKSFDFDKNTFSFNLEAEINLAEEYKEAELFADVHNISESTEDFFTDPQTEKNTKGFIYKASGNLKETLNGHNQDKAVISVFAELKDMSGSDSHISVMEFPQDIQYTLDLTHPRSQESYIVIPNDNNALDIPVRNLTDEKPLFKKDPLYVTIAFYRMPTAAELADVDYFCKFGKMEGDHPVLAVPTMGTVTLIGAEFVKDSALYPDPNVTCYLSDPYGGIIVTGSSEYEKSIEWEINDNKRSSLYFCQFDKPWGIPYMEPGGFTPKTFSYTIAVNFYRKKNNVYSGPLSIKISSNSPINEKDDGTIVRMPYLIIAWGCLEESTEILLDDGTSRKIRDISIGDRVRTSEGKQAVVKNVWKGTDDRLFKITVENGISVAATYNHPFPSADGWKCPADMREGDMLLDSQGNRLEITTVMEMIGDFKVVNLQFEEPTIIIANGLQAGDYDAQNGRFPE